MKEDSLSAIKEKAALRDKSSVVMEKQAELQETEKFGMKIHIKKPFLTDAEKRAQDWVLRAKSPKVPLPISWQDLKRVLIKSQ